MGNLSNFVELVTIIHLQCCNFLQKNKKNRGHQQIQLVLVSLPVKIGKFSTQRIVFSCSIIDISVGKNHDSEREMNNHIEGERMSMLTDAIFHSISPQSRSVFAFQLTYWCFCTLLSQHIVSSSLVMSPFSSEAMLFSHTEGGIPQNSPPYIENSAAHKVL